MRQRIETFLNETYLTAGPVAYAITVAGLGIVVVMGVATIAWLVDAGALARR